MYNGSYLIHALEHTDDDQGDSIKDIDFDSLLQLDCGVLPWSFVQWLADHAHVENEELTFDDKSIPLSPDSFRHVLGISTLGNHVPVERKTSTAVVQINRIVVTLVTI